MKWMIFVLILLLCIIIGVLLIIKLRKEKLRREKENIIEELRRVVQFLKGAAKYTSKLNLFYTKMTEVFFKKGLIVDCLKDEEELIKILEGLGLFVYNEAKNNRGLTFEEMENIFCDHFAIARSTGGQSENIFRSNILNKLTLNVLPNLEKILEILKTIS